MKYLDALLARKATRPSTTKPTKALVVEPIVPKAWADKTGKSSVSTMAGHSVSLVGGPPAHVEPRDVSPTVEGAERMNPPFGDDDRPPCKPPYRWRAEVAGWPVTWREVWGRHANQLEIVEGLRWWQAEQRSHVAVSRLRSEKKIPPGATPDAILARLVEV